jgi:multiple antibiotic resistance protein
LGASISSRPNASVVDVVTALCGVAIVAVSVSLSYRFADRLIALLGDTGAAVFVRLTAFILLCVGVGMMWGGLAELLHALMTSP